ncbi:hypothetical protein HYPSUDRAFT_72442 [Hypholoma sublateritium FD-334 SS-4]|uniref:Uncharacterized protein n=1 Tax=Hypholoma sublateritium (strain FD-334 SS-4) TaxID=945553 RepID=A0A0D2N6J6_HYPSF|nr:hypothetical protein HYPSUDRAFT_72442 [Hypholoma sublateritium FD-334 SS-4]
MDITVIVDDNDLNIHRSAPSIAPHILPALYPSPQPTSSSEGQTMHRLPAPVPIIAGLHTGGFAVVFIIAWAAATLWRRRRWRQTQLLGTVHPFSSDPTRLFGQLSSFQEVTMIDTKGRRRLLPPVEGPAHGMIPPSKLTLYRHPALNSLTRTVRTVRTMGTREEDSRLQMMGEPQMNVIRVLPPAYTVV